MSIILVLELRRGWTYEPELSSGLKIITFYILTIYLHPLFLLFLTLHAL